MYRRESSVQVGQRLGNRFADQYAAHAVAVTAPDTPQSRIASHVVSFLVEEPENIIAPTPARYLLPAPLDILAYEVTVIRGEAAMERMNPGSTVFANRRERTTDAQAQIAP